MKQNTQYQSAIHVEIWVSCAMYKLAHGVNFLICNELFAIGKSTMSLVLHEFVEVANITFKKLILWPVGAKMNVVMEGFGHLCGLSSVHSAIDGTHIQNLKPKTTFPKDYYYHKKGGYSIIVQSIVDSKKTFFDICVDL